LGYKFANAMRGMRSGSTVCGRTGEEESIRQEKEAGLEDHASRESSYTAANKRMLRKIRPQRQTAGTKAQMRLSCPVIRPVIRLS
jgi:hypothetical protein